MGGAGLWNWLPDFPNRWTGDFVWNFLQLGTWADLLGAEIVSSDVMMKYKS